MVPSRFFFFTRDAVFSFVCVMVVRSCISLCGMDPFLAERHVSLNTYFLFLYGGTGMAEEMTERSPAGGYAVQEWQ